MGTQAIEGLKRADAWRGLPEAVVIAGLDNQDTFPANPLVDDVSNATPVDEGLVAVMMAEGFVGSVDGTLTGPVVEIVDGRGRVRAAREANRRGGHGGHPILITVVLMRPDPKRRDLELFLAVEAKNRHRREVTPLSMARKAVLAEKAFGATVQDIAIAEGVTPQAVRGWLDLTKLTGEVQKAVESKTISANEARQLRGLTGADQEVALEEIAEKKKRGEKVTGTKAAKIAKEVASRPTASPASKRALTSTPRQPGKKDVKRVMARYEVSEDFRRGVLFAIGEAVEEAAFAGFALAPEAPPVVAPRRGRKVETPTLDGME